MNAELVIWRDSVAAGDDADAPHELRLPLPEATTLEQLLSRIREMHYLASIAGDRATWIVEADQAPLAVVAQQWQQPRFLVDPGRLIASLISATASPQLHFKYWCQAEPDEVFECLRNDRPLPSKYR